MYWVKCRPYDDWGRWPLQPRRNSRARNRRDSRPGFRAVRDLRATVSMVRRSRSICECGRAELQRQCLRDRNAQRDLLDRRWVTMLDQFNNGDNGGDYGDWITRTPTQVQDAFTNGTGNPALVFGSPEMRALDVIGFTFAEQSVPEPTSLSLLALGLAAISFTSPRKKSTGLRLVQRAAIRVGAQAYSALSRYSRAAIQRSRLVREPDC
jgi:hypothetical protein